MSKVRMECLGCRGAKEIIKSLKNPANHWMIKPTPSLSPFGVQLECGSVKVVIFPNERCPCQRIFDNVRVLVNDVDYYMTPVKRLKVRCAARARVHYQALPAL